MSNRAWMPLHIDSYLADTSYLTAAEHGAYMLLIMTYWRDGGLPDDERMIARIAKMGKDEWAESRDVLAAFFRDGWRHNRIDAELAKADEIIEKRRNAALGRHAKSKVDAHALHVQSISSDTGVPPRTLDQSVKEEPNGSSKKRGCRLPDDFQVDRDWAVAEGLSPSQARTEAARFRDYWIGQPGAKGVKLDWPATWRNWVRSALERISQPRGSPIGGANLADAFGAIATAAENRNDPRYSTSDQGPRGAIPHLSRVQG